MGGTHGCPRRQGRGGAPRGRRNTRAALRLLAGAPRRGPTGTLRWEASPGELAAVPDDDLEDRLRERLEAQRPRDLAAGLTTSGPHRDDVFIGAGERDLRRLGSQGEQRTAALAMLLAHRDQMRGAGAGPILLLDDVLSG